MRSFFYILVIVLLTAMATGAGLYCLLDYASSKLNGSGKDYVNANIHAIIDNWSVDELIQRENAEFRDATSDEEVYALFELYRKLGTLHGYESCAGNASIETGKDGLRVTATYIVSASFANGDAEIKISLIQVKNEWQVLGFRVISPKFQ